MGARFPLFKGATRAATVGGVPLIPFVGLVLVVASTAIILGVYWLAALVPGWLVMAQITRGDDRAFRVLSLWLQTKALNRLRMLAVLGRGEFWGASTYSLADGRRRSWEGESRWGG